MAARAVPYQQQSQEISPLFIDASRHMETAQGTRSDGAAPSSPKRRLAAAMACGLAMSLLLFAFSATSIPAGLDEEGKGDDAKKPHTGDYCSSSSKYSKENLKSLVDKPVAALLQSKDLRGQRKFEASDVLLKVGRYESGCSQASNQPSLTCCYLHITHSPSSRMASTMPSATRPGASSRSARTCRR